MEYTIEKTGKHDYSIRSYIGTQARDNRWHFHGYAMTMWGAKRELKKMKKRRAYEIKEALPKVVYREQT